MATVDQLKDVLITKILSINNIDVLQTLDKIISSSDPGTDIIELTEAQKKMLQMSEQDIKEGRLISQDAMMERNLEWLKEL